MFLVMSSTPCTLSRIAVLVCLRFKLLLAVAKVGDEVAAADPAPSEAQNYFAMLRQTPAALLLRLVVQWGCADATAERVAALLGCDLVRRGAAC